MSRKAWPEPGRVAADLATGSGLAEAVLDVDAIVHWATAARRGGDVLFTILRATQFPQLVDTLLTASSRLGPVLPLRVPGRIGRELRAGALTTQDRPAGTRSWDDCLAQRYGPRL